MNREGARMGWGLEKKGEGEGKGWGLEKKGEGASKGWGLDEKGEGERISEFDMAILMVCGAT